MKGQLTSYVGMFTGTNDELPALRLIEIPIIQRDYAQGRDVPAVTLIRDDFLDALVSALTGGKPISLDFVYGEIEDGTLRPLDGQQRLTTLFLLHWYVAARLDRVAEAQPWLQFAYATRPTAELFCRELVKPDNLPADALSAREPQEWIKDQPWYLYSWRHDPTVASMLNVLDAIHRRLGDPQVDLDAVWQALTSTEGDPAIGFYFLPIDDMPSGEELYIKMNSRGKTLTSWENLKPRLEKLVSGSLTEANFSEFVRRIDGIWTDVLWRLEADGGDWRVDEEFERYLEFIIEVGEWRDGTPADGALLDRAERVLAGDGDKVKRNLAFLFHAFDTWTAEDSVGRVEPIDTGAVFASHFASTAETGTAIGDRVVLFEESRDVDLFRQCCDRYGLGGKNRLFTLAQTLVLFAVLIHRQSPKADVQRRLRVLRNLTDTAGNEVIEARMPDLVAAVEQLMSAESIDAALEWMESRTTFNPDRIADEREKLSLFPDASALQATVFALEDHVLLRGRIFPFDLAPEGWDRLPARTKAFQAITPSEHWPLLTRALLSSGDYGYRIWNLRQFGTVNPTYGASWRDVLTRYGRKNNEGLRTSLAKLLDRVSGQESDPASALQAVIDAFLEDARGGEEPVFDWRYYLVTYPIMSSAPRGVYQGEFLQETGLWFYSMCLMTTQSGGFGGGATYHDPFLMAVREHSGLEDGLLAPTYNLGSPAAPRWMRTTHSETGVRCVQAGFEVDAPQDPDLAETFEEVCRAVGVVDGLLAIQQRLRGEELLDTEDRIEVGARLVTALVEAGL
ncbi:DUF262 domain-containing protein [Nocardioides donggukensis]|uniref:DUF262 domain-containing protein n=1 Tax=Nocardioides donggukensis TaxID=2774019 RepID=A0A927PZX9_9ACTN|nr:DUF262 domain-containing protein [Nocardioides donggukensis]MBD8869895.1 DUF262 domain-containing protein [Nocardioides donggukensis]